MGSRYEGQTYYDLLEVKPTAGPTEIYSAYQRARSTFAPNSSAIYSMFTPDEAKELMSLIEEAYQTLSHQARRKEYDVKIGLTKHTPMVTSAVQKKPVVENEAPKSDTAWVGVVKTQIKKDDLPKGFARTKFSVYEVKTEFENEIQAREEFDGLFLQKVRLYKGVTLDQVANEIRVSRSTLVALEANDLEALPVAVFTRGFVVQYVRLLNLDERRTVDAYMKYFRANRN